MKKEVKIIFHIDLNAFFATVSMINEPYLKNKVFVVGGSAMSSKGVISTASYKARKLGIRSAMPISDAMRIYPKLLVVPVNFPEYIKYSNIFFEVLTTYSDKVLKGSIDEAYLDMTEASKTKHPLELAKEIQTKLNKEYNLPCSIGIAPTLFLAKTASDMKKPLGITVVRRKDIVKKIFPLPIKELFGMGKKTYPVIEKKGILTIGDFTKKENKEKILEVITKESYDSFINHILGYSTDIIDPDKYNIPKSISNETTFNYYLDNQDVLLQELKNLFDTVYRRLTKYKLLAKTVTIKIRNSNFETITRSKSLTDYTNEYESFETIMEELFFDNYHGDAIRLIGVGLGTIITKYDYREDYNLFTYQKLLEE
ncbi:DNA polymerase IV [Haploplasma axanthum]|uniref:DNA polymerase IV n=1 Tax=Haploplasma axanthum TaxID=29552 RepID=A0A449BDS9_HAPAX|nr:DNA polymerase IV [Haploplasma axanthum]VEU80614.1 DNA polymerase IV [Haploplasma axanthum]